MSDRKFVTPSAVGVRLADMVGRVVAMQSLGRVEKPIESEFGSRTPLRVLCLAIGGTEQAPVGENLGTTLVFPPTLASVIEAGGGDFVVGRLARIAVQGFDDREAYVLEEISTEKMARAGELFAKVG